MIGDRGNSSSDWADSSDDHGGTSDDRGHSNADRDRSGSGREHANENRRNAIEDGGADVGSTVGASIFAWVRDRLETAAALVVVGCFTVAFGPPGALAGITTAIVWYALGVPYALAVGHVLLVVLVAGDFGSGIDVAIVITGFVTLCVVGVGAARASFPEVFVALCAVIGSGAIAWGVSDRSLPIAAAVTLLSLFGASYVLHRYELVALELVPDSNHETTETTPSETEL
ncbi:hypothetical protein [Natrarchaeobius oligotrophus]|uniref:DUF8163 domain-containing protein n=1 Tax=Natrarchaeobius chitinivorans TaxID=1679083 RepID=A0A3N6N3N5_NATCH|nr:hypothetical protein [Natrarchaeobius chitinivorans]RQH02277.1 hypothetical protein EA472_02960 [Natrarchaeobius chitinivorans]